MAKTISVTFGVILIILGILGFVENPLIGSGSFFHTNIYHNVFSILIGMILLFVAFYSKTTIAGTYFTLGAIYIMLSIFGFIVLTEEVGTILNTMEINQASVWLMLLIAVLFLIAGSISATEENAIESNTLQ